MESCLSFIAQLSQDSATLRLPRTNLKQANKPGTSSTKPLAPCLVMSVSTGKEVCLFSLQKIGQKDSQPYQSDNSHLTSTAWLPNSLTNSPPP